MSSRTNSMSPSTEVRISIPPDEPLCSPVQTTSTSHLSLTTAVTESFSPSPLENIDERSTSIDKDTSEEKDRKKPRNKSFDESKPKRKDTVTSISNFIHRLIGDDKKSAEDKEKNVIVEESSHPIVERPDKLTLPEVGDTEWFELKSTEGYRTALDVGHEGSVPIYEWKTDSLDETIITEFSSPDRRLLKMENNDGTETDGVEKLSELLNNFRSKKMRAFSTDQLHCMQEVKKAHEQVTNLHLELNDIEFEGLEENSQKISAMYRTLGDQLTHMHDPFKDFDSTNLF